MRKGPLIVFGDASEGVRRLARNLPGVDACHVNRLNILQLAPGGHLGRFVVYTQDAFKQLNNVFGSYKAESTEKRGYNLNRSMMNCADIARIINSDQVQAKLRDVRSSVRAHNKTKANPLTNRALMNRLNPFAKQMRATLAKQEADRHAARAKVLKEKRSKAGRKAFKARTAANLARNTGLEKSYQDAQKIIDDEIKAGAYQPGDTEEEDE